MKVVKKKPAAMSAGHPVRAALPRYRNLALREEDGAGARTSEMQEELAKARRELMRKDRELERIRQEQMRLVGTAAHDLRHPLGALMVYSELLAETADTFGREQMDLLNNIRSSIDFLLRLTNDMLDFSAVEAGIVRFHREPCDLAEIVGRSVSLSQPLAAKKQMRLELQAEDSLPMIILDPYKLSQVFNNIIENALKYCPAGTHINVCMSKTRGGAVVSIRDNGPGMEPEELKHLFKPFQRLHEGRNHAEPGTGLGLAIAKRIVDHHRGRIWAESSPGQGSTFHVFLPFGFPVGLKIS